MEKKTSIRYRVLGISLGIILASILFFAEFPESGIIRLSPGNDGLSWGTPTPNVLLRPIDRKEPINISVLNGQDVGIVFSSIGCPYSQKMMRKLINVGDMKFSSQVFFISQYSSNQPSEALQAMRDSFQSRFTVVVDTTGEIFKAYNVKAVPSALWVSKSGHIRDAVSGFDDTRKLIESFVKHPEILGGLL